MIRPIVLLLIGVACLSLLDLSNGEHGEQDERIENEGADKVSGRQTCPSLYFNCYFHLETASICVPFEYKTRSGRCIPSISKQRIDNKCRAQRQSNTVFLGSQQTEDECK